MCCRKRENFDAPEMRKRMAGCSSWYSTMHLTMAPGAERDEVFLGIVTGVAAIFQVMNLQARHCTARLTSPTIAS